MENREKRNNNSNNEKKNNNDEIKRERKSTSIGIGLWCVCVCRMSICNHFHYEFFLYKCLSTKVGEKENEFFSPKFFSYTSSQSDSIAWNCVYVCGCE